MNKKTFVRMADNGNPPRITVAQIDHKFVNGTHIFTSKGIKGLFLASKNVSKIKSQLIPAIEKLIKLNHGIEVKARVSDDFEHFLSDHEDISCTIEEESITDTLVIIEAA